MASSTIFLLQEPHSLVKILEARLGENSLFDQFSTHALFDALQELYVILGWLLRSSPRPAHLERLHGGYCVCRDFLQASLGENWKRTGWE